MTLKGYCLQDLHHPSFPFQVRLQRHAGTAERKEHSKEESEIELQIQVNMSPKVISVTVYCELGSKVCKYLHTTHQNNNCSYSTEYNGFGNTIIESLIK